jgi:glycosyltransferase involved in cell wall biosynthesis
MKILRCYLRVPPMPGGMETHIAELSKQQRKEGHYIRIIFNKGEITSNQDLQVLPNVDLYKTYRSPLSVFIFYLNVIIKLLQQREKYHVVHIHGDWSSFIFAFLLRKITHAKCVAFTLHDVITDSYQHRYLLPLTLKFSDIVFCTGYETFRKVADKCNALFQPSGVRDEFHKRYGSKRNGKQIITVAVLRKKKNIGTLLDIAAILPEYDFVIVGDGDEIDAIRVRSRVLNLKNIRLTGHLESNEISRLMSESALFLYTSLQEGTPTAIMEAMAQGLPVVSSNAGCIESIVKDGVNGYVVRQDYTDPKAYVSYIKHIMQDENLRDFMGNNNISMSGSFRWETVAELITLKISSQLERAHG